MTCKLCDICGKKCEHERCIAFFDRLNFIGECDICSACMVNLLDFMLDMSDEDERTIADLKKKMEVFK